MRRRMNLIIKKYFCKIGWHSFGYDLVEHDGYHGIANKYKCKTMTRSDV